MLSSAKIGMLTIAVILPAIPLFGQQKGQWLPGQMGLNAGVVPDPGFTYMNMAINYSASQLKRLERECGPRHHRQLLNLDG